MSYTASTTVVGGKSFAWSYSALKNYETCAKRYYHYNVRKDIVEPESQELAEGNRLHDVFAKRLDKATPLPLGFARYEPMLARLANAPGEIMVEQKLAISSTFQPTAYFARDTWFRTVVDAAKVNDGVAVVPDWKTGKPKPDDTQLALMAGTVFIHLPQVQRVKAALVFVNYNEVIPAEYAREDQGEIWNMIIPRVRALEQAVVTQEYPPKPGGLCKRYCAVVSCPYHGRGV